MLHATLFLSLAAVLGLLASGCSGDTCSECGVGGGGGSSTTTASPSSATPTGCQSTQGTIAGTVYRSDSPGAPPGQIAANALLLILTAPDATPLYGKADAMGQYSIPLDAGQWYIGGEDEGGCETTELAVIQLEACETEVLDVILDVCFDG